MGHLSRPGVSFLLLLFKTAWRWMEKSQQIVKNLWHVKNCAQETIFITHCLWCLEKQTWSCGTGGHLEMACQKAVGTVCMIVWQSQLVRCLPHQHSKLSLISRTHKRKARCDDAYFYSSDEKEERGGLLVWGSLGIQHSLPGEFQVNETLFHAKKKQQQLWNAMRWASYAYAQQHIYVPINTVIKILNQNCV